MPVVTMVTGILVPTGILYIKSTPTIIPVGYCIRVTAYMSYRLYELPPHRYEGIA
jgi:hypothetical protein